MWTEGYSADVTYYITDAGSVLNATYACSILKRLSLQEMSSVTTPYTVNTTPRPLQSTTSETSDDDEEHPFWFIPVVVAGSVGFVIVVVVIIVYCRWKKGAPTKKILPQTGSPIEEQVQKPRVIELTDLSNVQINLFKRNTFIVKLFVSHHSERDPPDLHRMLNLTKLNKIVHYATVNNE